MASRPAAAAKSTAGTDVNSNGTSNTTTAAEKKSAVALAAAQRREAQRKQLLELKRKNRQAVAMSDESTIQHVTPATKSNGTGVETNINESSWFPL